MKYYVNDRYPIGIVLSNDLESVRKEYLGYDESNDEELPDISDKAEAVTYLMKRKVDHSSIAVGIVFNTIISAKLAAREGFHALCFIKNQLGLTTDEEYAYLAGWIGDCIYDFNNIKSI